ncbi:IS110 family transposase [Moritella dasanensis]|uniref:IS110 family transposase n=1 Tax=Moritella dasanensis TaxID=428031 RepID=UPI0002D934BD|nr:IS110 family transposase [Moritella dasanensis]
MRFYNETHPYYCGIDLHARSLYICIINGNGIVVLHKEIKPSTEKLCEILAPFIDNIVVGVECMDCWYWLSDYCENNNIKFILGHALYMKAIHAGKAKNDRIDSYKIAILMRSGTFPLAYVYAEEMRATRDLLRRRNRMVNYRAQLKAHVKNTTNQYNLLAPTVNLRYPKSRESMRNIFKQANESVLCSVNLDLDTVEHMNKDISKVERHIEAMAKQHNTQDYSLLKSIPGVGQIIALTILYEIGNINRFASVQNFASYSCLIKCKADSGGKSYGSRGNKIGNGHLKLAFSQMSALYLRDNSEAQLYFKKLQKRMSKAKALAVLSHKLGRCVYYMLKNKSLFDKNRLLN